MNIRFKFSNNKNVRYDAQDRVKSIQTKGENTRFFRDQQGRVQSVCDGPKTTVYTYDEKNQLNHVYISYRTPNGYILGNYFMDGPQSISDLDDSSNKEAISRPRSPRGSNT